MIWDRKYYDSEGAAEPEWDFRRAFQNFSYEDSGSDSAFDVFSSSNDWITPPS